MRRRRLHQSLDVLWQRGWVVLDAQQIVRAVFQHQLAGAGFGLGRGEQLDLDLGQRVRLGLSGGASGWMHARRMKNLRGQVQPQRSTHAAPISYRCMRIGCAVRTPTRSAQIPNSSNGLFTPNPGLRITCV